MMEIKEAMATQINQWEDQVSLNQTDNVLVEFYLEDDGSFVELTADTKNSGND
jgi:hypothetical protein